MSGHLVYLRNSVKDLIYTHRQIISWDFYCIASPHFCKRMKQKTFYDNVFILEFNVNGKNMETKEKRPV